MRRHDRRRVELRQSYLRVAKRAAIMVGRYTHAHQFKRARRELKFLRTRLGRIIRDIRRKIEGDAARQDRFGPLLDLALRVRHQEQRQRGPKVYSLHAPEVECIGRGKARAPYEFGCKVSIATPATAPKGGQFVLHAKALHGNPYDGHTLRHGRLFRRAGLEQRRGAEIVAGAVHGLTAIQTFPHVLGIPGDALVRGIDQSPIVSLQRHTHVQRGCAVRAPELSIQLRRMVEPSGRLPLWGCSF